MTQKSYSSLADQNTEYLASNTARIRPQTPLYRESADVVRPFDPSTDSRIHAVAEVYQNHPQWVADSRFDNSNISQEYLFSVDDGDRSIEVFEGHGPQYDVSAYPIEESVGVPISTVSDGDRVDLLSISEDCEYYDGDSPPTFVSFDTTLAVVPDISIDGVGVAPLADISEDTPHLSIGRVDQLDGFGFKSEKRGFGESVPVEIER